LVAANAGAKVTVGPESFTTDPLAPLIIATTSSPLSGEATLEAQINPRGLATTYHFEYGPTAAYGQSTATKTIPAGASPVTVKTTVTGLTQGSAYHFRVVAANSVGPAEGPDRSFITGQTGSGTESCPNALVRAQQGAQGLAGCRAYEMVSPLDKNNGDVSSPAGGHSATDGNAFEYFVQNAFAGAEGNEIGNEYTAWRSPTGWTTEALSPYFPSEPIASVQMQGYQEFSSDLSKGVLITLHDPSDKTNNITGDQKALYLRTKGQHGFIRLTPPSPTNPHYPWIGPVYAGSSSEMDRIFFESTEPMTFEAPASGTNAAYEWHDGVVSLIGVLPGGEISPGPVTVGRGGKSVDGGIRGETQAAISADGSQVVFAAGTPSQLYLRSEGHSKQISLSQRSGEVGAPAPDGATFMGSARDGEKLSTIYFASPDLLTDDAHGEPSAEGANELYAYDVQSEKLTFLSGGAGLVDPPGVHLYVNWLGTAGDGSYVYFIADSRSNQTSGPGGGVALYVWHDGEVTLASSEVVPSGNGPNYGSDGPFFVSSDGKRILLVSNSPLTADAPPARKNGTRLQEVYLFDAPSSRWSCLSCNPNGATSFEGRLKDTETSASYTGVEGRMYHAHSISSDGSRAFFETREALLPQDTNGASDVYEWNEGKLNLISSGHDPEGAHFLDASPDGHDVFITTRAQLVPEDRDHNVDAYDVREDGGFLREAIPGECSGEACQGTPGSMRTWSALASGAVGASGNTKAKRKSPRCAPARKGRRAKHPKAGRHSKRTAQKLRCVKRHSSKKGGRR
jgi:hypothetical protein